jgi:hypothetical protein
MAAEKGVNSYADLDEANEYFETRLDAAAWTDITDEDQKEKALVTATTLLDSYEWTGIAVSESQPLAFPRVGEYFDPRVGSVVAMEGTPDRIVRATIELAYHLLNNDGLLDETGGVDSISLGPIQLTDLRAPSKIPAWIYRTVKPLMLNRGSRAWHRAW